MAEARGRRKLTGSKPTTGQRSSTGPLDLNMSEVKYKIEQANEGINLGPMPGYNTRARVMLEAVALIKTWIASYVGYEHQFKQSWKYARLAIPLQIRLLVEQCLYEQGGKFRDLVTGFGPVSN